MIISSPEKKKFVNLIKIPQSSCFPATQWKVGDDDHLRLLRENKRNENETFQTRDFVSHPHSRTFFCFLFLSFKQFDLRSLIATSRLWIKCSKALFTKRMIVYEALHSKAIKRVNCNQQKTLLQTDLSCTCMYISDRFHLFTFKK